MTEEKKITPGNFTDIVRSMHLLLTKSEVLFPIEDSNAENLHVMVKKIEGSYFNVTQFDTTEKRAPGHFCLILKDHPMSDGNKRLALL